MCPSIFVYIEKYSKSKGTQIIGINIVTIFFVFTIPYTTFPNLAHRNIFFFGTHVQGNIEHVGIFWFNYTVYISITYSGTMGKFIDELSDLCQWIHFCREINELRPTFQAYLSKSLKQYNNYVSPLRDKV